VFEKRIDQITANGATNTSRFEQEHVLANILDEQMVEWDGSELIDHDQGS
jgi:hypothetical protein